jgi:Protein of unknown function (DUF3592)
MTDPVVFLSRLGKFAFIPLGLSLLLGAAWAVSSTKTWLAHAIEVEGKVIEMVRMRNSDDTGYLFAPVVRFKTVEGNTVEFESSLHSNPPGYHAGQTVSVFYDPDEPRSAAIKGFFSLWLVPIILGFIGTVFLIVGTAMVVMSSWAGRFFEQSLSPAASPSSARAAAAPAGPSSGRAAAR